MDPKRTCPECNLIFEAPIPPSGRLTCPICNTVFSAAPVPTAAAPRISSAASARQVFRGCLAIGALILLSGSLVYAYRLMNGMEHKTAVHSPPPDDPAEMKGKQASGNYFGPVETIPNSFAPPASPPRREPIAEAPKPPSPAPEAPPRPLTLAERVNRAIDRGVLFLQSEHSSVNQYRNYLALVGLALLECGVPVKDPTVQQIAALLHKREADLVKTYELALAILFFDRLGDRRDESIICTFGRRLLEGQIVGQSWTYECSARYSNLIRQYNFRRRGRPAYHGDNSNTQFALLGLWVAQRHGIAARDALRSSAEYFRETQMNNGSWGYRPRNATWTHSMTCAGLMSLAMRYGVSHRRGSDIRPDQSVRVSDAAIFRGLRYLDRSLGNVTLAGNRILGVDARGALYFLWSLERMAVIYDLKKICDREWYPWAAEILVETQRPNGSWAQGHPAAIDTCFALLILKRSNFAPDLKLDIQDNLPFAMQNQTPRPKPSLDFQTRPAGPIILQGRDEIFGSIAEKTQQKKGEKSEPLNGIPAAPGKK